MLPTVANCPRRYEDGGGIDAKTRDLALDYRVVAGAALFDPEWYLRTYPDVADAGMDAAEHYLHFGAAEGRDPGPHFQSSEHNGEDPMVVPAGSNALVVFLRSVTPATLMVFEFAEPKSRQRRKS